MGLATSTQQAPSPLAPADALGQGSGHLPRSAGAGRASELREVDLPDRLVQQQRWDRSQPRAAANPCEVQVMETTEPSGAKELRAGDSSQTPG